MIHENKELEESILGTVIQNPEILITINPILKVDYLYHFQNKTVLRAIYTLLESKSDIDLLSVTLTVKKTGDLESIGGSAFIAGLATKAVSPYSIEQKCRIIHQLFMLRELKSLGDRIIKYSIEPSADPFDISEMIEGKITEIINIKSDKIPSIGEVFAELITEINEVLDSGKPTGILSGLKNLDNRTGGWQNGNLIIVAARPGMGKTATALHLAKFPGFNGTPIAIFSLEMTAQELVGRLASSETQINSTLINQKKIDRFQLNQLGANCNALIDAPIYIDDTSGLTITDLKSKAKKLFYERDIKMIIVDYLQLMRGEGEGNREQEISSISRGLKTLAKDLNIPVIALAQLNRQCEARADKRPILSDLRDGGSIEQDADIVSFLFRPEMYKDVYKMGYEFNGEVIDTNNLMIFDIAKGRGLQTREIALKFYGEFMRIENYNMF